VGNKTKELILGGGLGNNLFQLNKAFYLKKMGYRVLVNTALLENRKLSSLLGWSFHDNQIAIELCDIFEVGRKITFVSWFSLLALFLKSRLGISDIMDFDYTSGNRIQFGYYQKNFKLCPEFASYLDGYFEGKRGSQVMSLDKIAVVHVRRGDFITKQLAVNYYVDAIKRLGVNEVMVISHDADDGLFIKKGCQRLGFDISLTPSDACDIWEDFLLIKNANFLVMSNSTFCYWAVLLNANCSVVYPSHYKPGAKWFLPIEHTSNQCLAAFEIRSDKNISKMSESN
jgi:hypothetical protein